MKISIRGWKRDHGAKSLFNREIDSLEIVKEPSVFAFDKTYLMKTTNPLDVDHIDKFVISRSVEGLVASGDYQINIEISRDEILALARRIIKDMTVEKFSRFALKG